MVTAVAVAAVEAVDPITPSQAVMWARPAVLIIKVPLMMEHSLILLMTVESHWNLSVAQAMMIRGFDAAVADMEVGQIM